MNISRDSKSFILFLSGLLSAFGPFVMDMFLPSLPAMSDYFHTSSSMMQLGLTSGMIGLAIGQLLFGPLSDTYGRRMPLIIAVLLFLVSTLGCIYSGGIQSFIMWRFFQGLAGAGGVVISRSVIADRFNGQAMASMMAVVGAINGLATVAAPLGGGMIDVMLGWKGVFWFLFFLGVFLLLCCVRFRETLQESSRKELNVSKIMFQSTDILFKSPSSRHIIHYGLTMGLLFVYISSAPFIMQEKYNLSPGNFSICYGINSIAMMLFPALVLKHFSITKSLKVSNYAMLLFSFMIAVSLFLDCSFWVYEILSFMLLSVIGVAYTVSNTLAMDKGRSQAGMTSALLGATGFIFGGIVSSLVGIGNMSVSVGLLYISCAITAFLVSSNNVYDILRLPLRICIGSLQFIIRRF